MRLAYVFLFAIVVLATPNDCSCSQMGSTGQNIFLCSAATAFSLNFDANAYDPVTHHTSADISREAVRARTEENTRERFTNEFVHDRAIAQISQQLRGFSEQRSSSQSAAQRSSSQSAAQRGAATAEKRTDATISVCDCLDNFLSCLSDTCAGNTQAQTDICNFNAGRVFSHCYNCTGFAKPWADYQTAMQIITDLDKFQPAVASYVLANEPLITMLTFNYDYTVGVLSAMMTVADGVQDATHPKDSLVYYLSMLFDVLPGTIDGQVVASSKRGTMYTVNLNVVDEQTLVPQVSSASSVFSLFAAVVVAVRLLF